MSAINNAGEPPPYWMGYVYSEPLTNGSINITVCPNCSQWLFEGITHTCPTLTVWPAPVETKPHKCPCCDGRGKRECVQPLDCVTSRPEPCSACGGAGVLWK